MTEKLRLFKNKWRRYPLLFVDGILSSLVSNAKETIFQECAQLLTGKTM